mmetsp:Transcript_22482/g.45063  ORF Transcript_22482/g.45063 Transcript_22482/m.45063 type:complete len:374 (-) Transcript_22482:628-1749(-)
MLLVHWWGSSDTLWSHNNSLIIFSHIGRIRAHAVSSRWAAPCSRTHMVLYGHILRRGRWILRHVIWSGHTLLSVRRPTTIGWVVRLVNWIHCVKIGIVAIQGPPVLSPHLCPTHIGTEVWSASNKHSVVVSSAVGSSADSSEAVEVELPLEAGEFRLSEEPRHDLLAKSIGVVDSEGPPVREERYYFRLPFCLSIFDKAVKFVWEGFCHTACRTTSYRAARTLTAPRLRRSEGGTSLMNRLLLRRIHLGHSVRWGGSICRLVPAPAVRLWRGTGGTGGPVWIAISRSLRATWCTRRNWATPSMPGSTAGAPLLCVIGIIQWGNHVRCIPHAVGPRRHLSLRRPCRNMPPIRRGKRSVSTASMRGRVIDRGISE